MTAAMLTDDEFARASTGRGDDAGRLARAFEAMAAENARLRDQNARLVALLEEESAGEECSRMGGAGKCGWNVPGLEPIPPCWACRRDALLAETEAGA